MQIRTNKIAILEEEIRFSKMVEKLRKNVERCFGSLKVHFQILRFGLSEKYYKDVDDGFLLAVPCIIIFSTNVGFRPRKNY